MTTPEAIVAGLLIVSFFTFLTVLLVTAIKNPVPAPPPRHIPPPPVWTSRTPIPQKEKNS